MLPCIKERPNGDFEKMHQDRPGRDANEHQRGQPEVTFNRCRPPSQPGQGGGEANRVDRHAQRHQAPSYDKFRKHEAGQRRSSAAEFSVS